MRFFNRKPQLTPKEIGNLANQLHLSLFESEGKVYSKLKSFVKATKKSPYLSEQNKKNGKVLLANYKVYGLPRQKRVVSKYVNEIFASLSSYSKPLPGPDEFGGLNTNLENGWEDSEGPSFLQSNESPNGTKASPVTEKTGPIEQLLPKENYQSNLMNTLLDTLVYKQTDPEKAREYLTCVKRALDLDEKVRLELADREFWDTIRPQVEKLDLELNPRN